MKLFMQVIVVVACVVGQALSAPSCSQVRTMSQAIQGILGTNDLCKKLFVRLGNKFNFFVISIPVLPNLFHSKEPFNLKKPLMIFKVFSGTPWKPIAMLKDVFNQHHVKTIIFIPIYIDICHFVTILWEIRWIDRVQNLFELYYFRSYCKPPKRFQ